MSKDYGSLPVDKRMIRDITLELIEEFQASEVPLYNRVPRVEEQDHGHFRKDVLIEICKVTFKILNVFGNAYLHPDTVSVDKIDKELRNFYNEEVQKRTNSKLIQAFRDGRDAIKEITDLKFKMQRIHNTEPKNMIPDIISVVEKIRYQFLALLHTPTPALPTATTPATTSAPAPPPQ